MREPLFTETNEPTGVAAIYYLECDECKARTFWYWKHDGVTRCESCEKARINERTQG